MSENQASAYLCMDGKAVFFDEEGNQIVSMQQHGWCGLHLFREKYPNAPVKILMYEDNIDVEWVFTILKQLKKPRKSKKNDTIRITS